MACIRTSIFSFQKTSSSLKNLFTSKMMRRDESHSIKNIIENLEFIDSLKFKLPGRYPKIGTTQRLEIIRKIFSFNKKNRRLRERRRNAFLLSIGLLAADILMSSRIIRRVHQKKSLLTYKKFTKIIVATLSTSLFWFYQQTYTNGLDLKRFEIEAFLLFDLEKLSAEDLSAIESLYDEYLSDIERNVSVRTSSDNSSYTVSQFKNYKLNRSKHLVDKLDDLIGKFYSLSTAEIDFIKNFELEIKMSGADNYN